MGAMSMRGDAPGVRRGRVGSLCGRRRVGCLVRSCPNLPRVLESPHS
jgi:hypothetical protein